MAIKTWAPGDVLTAGDLNTYTRDQPDGYLNHLIQASTVGATGTTRVNVIASTNIILTATRHIRILFWADTCTGTTGGETGRLIINVDGGEVGRQQWYAAAAGAVGEVGVFGAYEASLASGTHPAKVDLIRVTGGTQVNVTNTHMLIEDIGA